MKQHLATLFGKFVIALLCVLAFLTIGSLVGLMGHHVSKAGDRYEQGQRNMITAHKLDNQLNQAKE